MRIALQNLNIYLPSAVIVNGTIIVSDGIIESAGSIEKPKSRHLHCLKQIPLTRMRCRKTPETASAGFSSVCDKRVSAELAALYQYGAAAVHVEPVAAGPFEHRVFKINRASLRRHVYPEVLDNRGVRDDCAGHGKSGYETVPDGDAAGPVCGACHGVAVALHNCVLPIQILRPDSTMSVLSETVFVLTGMGAMAMNTVSGLLRMTLPKFRLCVVRR